MLSSEFFRVLMRTNLRGYSGLRQTHYNHNGKRHLRYKIEGLLYILWVILTQVIKNGPRGPEVLWIYVHIYIWIILINKQQCDGALS